MDIRQEIIRFNSDGNNLLGRLVAPKEQPAGVGIVFLHGGGKDIGKDLFIDWQDFLGGRGISSFAFDFRGAPFNISDPTLKSEGLFEDSTLNNRLIDAENAVQFFLQSGFVDPEKLALGGVSMGGHVAARLAGKYPDLFKALILHAPAAYAAEAEDKRHDGSFKAVITQDNSWANSPAYDALDVYKNPRYLFYGRDDPAIPLDVKLRYMRKNIQFGNGFGVDMPLVGHSPLGSNDFQEKNFRHSMLWDSVWFLNAVHQFKLKQRMREHPEDYM